VQHPEHGDLDGYENLILLCRRHHKVVDEQTGTYTVDLLRERKAAHEAWVQARLESGGEATGFTWELRRDPVLIPLQTGAEAIAVTSGAHLGSWESDEPRSPADGDQMAGFLAELEDWNMILDEMTGGERLRVGYQLSGRIRELADAGLAVFGCRVPATVRYMGQTWEDWEASFVKVVYADSPEIVRPDFGISPDVEGEQLVKVPRSG
jgi:hypothetical protein